MLLHERCETGVPKCGEVEVEANRRKLSVSNWSGFHAGIMLTLKVIHVPEDELQILLAIVLVSRVLECSGRTSHAISEQPRLIKPGVEFALDTDFRLRYEAGRICKGLPIAAINHPAGCLRQNMFGDDSQFCRRLVLSGRKRRLKCSKAQKRGNGARAMNHDWLSFERMGYVAPA